LVGVIRHGSGLPARKTFSSMTGYRCFDFAVSIFRTPRNETISSVSEFVANHDRPPDTFGALQGIASVFDMKTSDLLRKAKL